MTQLLLYGFSFGLVCNISQQNPLGGMERIFQYSQADASPRHIYFSEQALREITVGAGYQQIVFTEAGNIYVVWCHIGDIRITQSID